MISWDDYLIFLGACLMLCITPGPDMILVLSRSIAQGKKAGLMASLGINIGGYVHLTASVLGLSAILATSPLAFNIIKWLGAAYLIYMGIQAFLSKQSPFSIEAAGTKPLKYSKILWQGFWSNVINPKVALFFLALLPQFVDAQGTHRVIQLLVLGVSLSVFGVFFNIALVYGASFVSQGLRRNPNIAPLLSRIMAIVFMALGLRLFFE